jgi:16S rRNA (guanine966-N2)-methyltransferase
MANNLRITSGAFRGRLITTPSGDTHPMGDRERLAIFNSLGNDALIGADILDMFAGSGALGLEALSRGASFVTFIDKSRPAQVAIRQNLATLFPDTDPPAEIYANLTHLANAREYDLIFADPPYDNPQWPVIDELVKLLKPGGILVLSHASGLTPQITSELTLISDRTYARANIKFYQKVLH